MAAALLLREALDDVRGSTDSILPTLEDQHRQRQLPRCGVISLGILIEAKPESLGPIQRVVEDLDVAGLPPALDAARPDFGPAIPFELDRRREQDETRDRVPRLADLARGGLDGHESAEARPDQHDLARRQRRRSASRAAGASARR